jgi:hypothetical protein
MYADAYSVSPSAVFVPPESPIKTPEDLRGVPISVGHQSGSHYSTIQALEQYMPLSDIKLSFADGILFSRMEKVYDRKVPAAAVFSGPYYFLEQMGFRKVIDTTFMMASMLNNDPDPDDVKKYFRALRHATLGSGRAHRFRALHQGSIRGIVPLDPRAPNLRRAGHGRRSIRRCLCVLGGQRGRAALRVTASAQLHRPSDVAPPRSRDSRISRG